jgi:hypothetical protein
MSKKLRAYTEKLELIDSITRSEMLSLFEQYYDNVNEQKFYFDLEKKDRVIMLKDKKTDELKGFSTLVDLEVMIDGKMRFGLFSGDTIIDKSYWGQSALTFEFFKQVFLGRLKRPFQPFYWLLISKGFKTYLLLANNFTYYFPRYDKEMTKYSTSLTIGFAQHLFSNQYKSETQLVVYNEKSDVLKEMVAPIDENILLLKPKIRFFQDLNPGWRKGDELVCLGQINLGLCIKYLSRTLFKMIKKSIRV